MHRFVAAAYLISMLGISSLLFCLPDAQGDVILTLAAMGIAYGAVDHALRESE
jgi:hypothetical protein